MKRESLDRAVAFIDSWLDYRYRHLDLPGFVVAVAKKGQIVFNKAYGFANIEAKEKLTKEHLFRIASHSKTIAATAVMQLAEQGKLNIDEPVAKHVEWLRQHNDARVSKITARQLMSHSSGMIRDGIDGDYWLVSRPFPDLEDLKAQIFQAQLIFDCNEKMKYSNFGYSLLGCLIEAASGLTFDEYVKKHILEPLQLKDTGTEFSDRIADRLVTGYTRRNLDKQRLPITKHINTESMSAATGCYSTAADLCTYFSAHFPGSGKLLTDESKKEMQRTQWKLNNSNENEEYGLGFGIEYVGKWRLFGHGGGFPGQSTNTLCHRSNDLVIVVLTNCIDGDAGAIGKGIISAITQLAEHNDESQQSSASLRKFEGRFMTIWKHLDIVQTGDKLIAIEPGSWTPFKDRQVLHQVDDNKLRIVSANGYLNEGELAIYEFDQTGERVNSVRYGGCTMLPESDFYERLETTISDRVPQTVSK